MPEMKIVDIDTTGRFRKDLGDLDGLSNSIAKHGLLHPPVVTTAGKLVCGFRRLDAAWKLGWKEIEVRVIDPDDLLEAENDENEVRKSFTPSERTAIAKAIEDRIGERRGERTDKPAVVNEHRQNIAEVHRGQRTRDVAAKKAGFGNRETFRQAEKVVDQGTPELVEAMDSGDVSISAAATVSELPPEEQRETVAKGPKAVKEKAAEIRQGKSKVNGQVVADPPDVAKLRAAGKIAADVVVDVHEPAANDELEPEPEPTKDADLSDEEWLDSLPAYALLFGPPKKVFESDAMIYRRLEKHRKTFQHHAVRVLNSAKRRGRYARVVSSFLGTDHPRHWLVCTAPENGGCGGTGLLPTFGEECPRCYGKGYWINGKGNWTT